MRKVYSGAGREVWRVCWASAHRPITSPPAPSHCPSLTLRPPPHRIAPRPIALPLPHTPRTAPSHRPPPHRIAPPSHSAHRPITSPPAPSHCPSLTLRPPPHHIAPRPITLPLPHTPPTAPSHRPPPHRIAPPSHSAHRPIASLPCRRHHAALGCVPGRRDHVPGVLPRVQVDPQLSAPRPWPALRLRCSAWGGGRRRRCGPDCARGLRLGRCTVLELRGCALCRWRSVCGCGGGGG